MKNIANADRPKSVGAMLPPRPFRGSGKVAQTACNSDRREGKSCIPTLNQTFADSRILKISKFPTFRIAESQRSFNRNGILASLSPEDFESLAPHLNPLTFKVRHVFFRPHEPIETVVFPVSGF